MIGDCLEATASQPDRLSLKVFSQPLVLTPALPQCEVCVIVPVRNEAQTLESTLKALAYQTHLEGKPFDPKRYEIILLANNCSDNSAMIAHWFAKSYPNLVLAVSKML